MKYLELLQDTVHLPLRPMWLGWGPPWPKRAYQGVEIGFDNKNNVLTPI